MHNRNSNLKENKMIQAQKGTKDEMIALDSNLKVLVEKAKEYGIEKIIISCNSDNLASSLIIQKNHGELFESVNDSEGNLINRYLIK